MTNMHGIARFAFVLLAAVAFAYGAHLLAAADSTPPELGEAATPNHDQYRVSPMPTEVASMPDELAAWDPVMLRAEPEPAASSAPTFVAADTSLYSRANARLRAAPSTAADIVAKLPANAPLHVVARSTDGTWWQVSLADPPEQDERTAFVHRDAVTKSRLAKAKPQATTAPAEAMFPLHVPARWSQGPLDLVDGATNWLADMAGRPQTAAPKKAIRAEH